MSELTGHQFNPYWPPEMIEAWKKANEHTCDTCGKIVHLAKVSEEVYCSSNCAAGAEFERKLP